MPRRPRPALIAGFALLGFLGVVAVRSQPADPNARLPRKFSLVGLIHREQAQALALRGEADRLRAQLGAIGGAAATRQVGAADAERRLRQGEEVAGLMAMAGPGLKVTLDDSPFQQSPTAHLNDLVVHSQA